MARTPSNQPTDGELEILSVLWEHAPIDLGGVRAALQSKRPVATTTVATMLKLMREKGLVERADGPRAYVWSARVSRKEARVGLLGKLLDLVFDGSARGLIAHMLDSGKLSEHDRDEIRRLLDTSDGKTTARRKGMKG